LKSYKEVVEMTRITNLASIHKKEDELLKKEMNEIYSGAVGGSYDCECRTTLVGSDFKSVHDGKLYNSCDCGSIWMAFGMFFTAGE
jgi:hypothetical protein